MHLNFKGRGEVRKLPEPVREHLRKRFILRTDYLNTLACFVLDGAFHDEPVKRIRIFSPDLARKYNLEIQTNSDLEQHPEVLLFEGHINPVGKIYFADRRPPWVKMERRPISNPTVTGA